MTDQQPIDQQPVPETHEPVPSPEPINEDNSESTEQLESDVSVPDDGQEEHAPKPVEEQEEVREKQPPTRFQLFLRKALIGFGIVALIFLAGFLTDHFVRYVPLADTLKTTQAQLEEANQAVGELRAELERMTRINQAAQDEIDSLEAELFAVRANALFYQVLVDVNTARLMVFLEDIEGAQSALASTQDVLEDLLPVIEKADPDLALSLPRRLDLIISGLGRDPETGLIDLELFTKDLLALEPLLAVD
ncbi:MAG: hypothetical protein ACNA70_08020 [Brevefilum sp.]